MKKLLLSLSLIASSSFAIKQGVYIGIVGGGALGLSDHTIKYTASGNLWDVSNTTSGGSGTSSGTIAGQRRTAKASRIAFDYSAGLRLGYVRALGPTHALRTYVTLGSSKISIGTKSKNSQWYFAPETHDLFQVGLASDYMFDLVRSNSYGLGVFIGLGYEHALGNFAKKTYTIAAQPYGNVGLFNDFGGGFGFELGAKLPFLPYYSGNPRLRDNKTSGVNKDRYQYIFITDTTATEYSSYKDSISTRVFTFYMSLNYVF